MKYFAKRPRCRLALQAASRLCRTRGAAPCHCVGQHAESMMRYMKTYVLALLCALACTSCTKQMTTLSDGQPGYVVHCEMSRARCIEDIALLCQGKNYMIISERTKEPGRTYTWPSPGQNTAGWHTSARQFLVEARCDK